MNHSSHPPLLPSLPQSLPALLYALAHDVPPAVDARAALERLRPLVQAYRVHASNMPVLASDAPYSMQAHLHPTRHVHEHVTLQQDALAEAESGMHAVRHIIDRLQRLRDAYGEWQHFDAPAYFDLTQEQAGVLVAVSERVTAVHVTFYADLLFPSFRAALRLWAGEGTAAGLHKRTAAEAFERYGEQVLPELTRRWQHAFAIIEQTRRLLAADIGYLAANGADEERWRWLDRASSPTDTQTGLPPMERIPTLTLTMDFPLPAFRQPGRLRRLRANRDQAARRKRRRK